MFLPDTMAQVNGKLAPIELCKDAYTERYPIRFSFLWRTSLHQLEIYPWTEQNDYLVFSDLESIAFGGG